MDYFSSIMIYQYDIISENIHILFVVYSAVDMFEKSTLSYIFK